MSKQTELAQLGDTVTVDSSGNVGINDTTPSQKLDVNGNVRVTGGFVEFSGDTSTPSAAAAIHRPADNQLAFSTANSERMRIDSTGRILIGHTSSIPNGGDNQRLQIKGTGSSDGISLARFNTTYGAYFTIGRSGSGTIGTYTAVPNNDEIGRIQWAVADGTDMSSVGASISVFTEQTAASNDVPSRLVFSTTADGSSSPTERMRINSNGNVGIGATPSNYSGYTNLAINGSTGGNLDLMVNGSQKGYLDSTSSGLTLHANSGAYLRFGAGGSERARIDSSGNFLVGKSTYNNDDNGAAFVPNGTSWFTATNDYPLGVNRKGSDGTLITFTNDQASCGTIACSGSSTSYNTSSDYRLKENVADLTGATDRLKQLQPKRFNFIVDPDTTVDGFLAHEVSSVVSEAITGEHNEVDADGNPVYQGIDQAKLVPLLTAALQEAITEIETLKTKVAALEAE